MLAPVGRLRALLERGLALGRRAAAVGELALERLGPPLAPLDLGRQLDQDRLAAGDLLQQPLGLGLAPLDHLRALLALDERGLGRGDPARALVQLRVELGQLQLPLVELRRALGVRLDPRLALEHVALAV